jgi:putative inorganic carbon (HCO3(-)) transporter
LTPDPAAISTAPTPRQVGACALGLSFFCWAHVTITRQPFPGSPASHDVGLYAAPFVALLTALLPGARSWRAGWPAGWRLTLAGCAMWLLVAIAASSRAPDALLALTWTGGLLLAMALLLGGVDRKGLAVGLAIGVAAELPLMLYQVVAQTTWPVAAIQNWASGDLSPAVRGAAVLGDGRWLRPYGLMPHPNVAGGVAAAACVLLAETWLCERRVWQLAAVAAAEAETLLSFSRSAWLGALCGLAVLALLRRRALRGLVWTAAVPAMLFLATFSGFIADRASARGTLESDSLSQRIYLVQTSLRFWKEQPLLGIGPAQFAEREVATYGSGFIPEPVHNGVFLVLSETGLLGLAGAGLMAYGIALRIAKAREWGVLATALAVLPPLMLDQYLMTFATGLMLLAAMLSPPLPDTARPPNHGA